MGKTLKLYVLWSIAAPFLLSLALLTGLLFLTQIPRIGEIVAFAGPSPSGLLKVAACLVPILLNIIAPIALVLGTVTAFTSLDRDGEIWAVFGAGVSPACLVYPALAAGLLCACAALLVSVSLQPAAFRQLGRIAFEFARVRAASGLQAGTFNEAFDGTTIYTGRRAGKGEGFGEVLFHDARDPKRGVMVFASSGRITSGREQDLLFLELRDGSIHPADRTAGTYRYATFERQLQSVGIGWQVSRASKFIGRFAASDTAALLRAAEDGSLPPVARGEASFELHHRLSFPFACLVMSLVGAVIGIPGRRGERRLTWAWAVASILAYYLLDRVGEAAAAGGLMTSWGGAWLANGLCGAAAAVALGRKLAG